MKYNTIPAGYRLTVTSWENDGDNYNTKTLDGLTLDKVSYLVDLCKILDYASNTKGNFGNLYEPSDIDTLGFFGEVKTIIHNHPSVLADFLTLVEGMEPIEDEAYYDYASEDLYELSLVGGEFFTRVCESFVVEYVPREIIMEDVTDKFK